MAKPQLNPVSDEDIVRFEKYVDKWRTLLNLRDWRIVRTPRRDPKNMACIESIHAEHKLARYSVGVGFGNHLVTPESLESTALHELLHVMLSPLIQAAFDDGLHAMSTAEREHAVIIVLEEMLMQAYGGNKTDA